MGGGRKQFRSGVESDAGPAHKYKPCRRKDERNLIEEWLANRPSSRYVETRDELLQLDPTEDGSVLGKFS